MSLRRLLLAACLVGCGSSEPVVAGDAAIAPADAPADALADTPADAPASALRRCATSGKGAVAGDECFLLTPAESGLPATGANAGVDQYALRPQAGARGKLLLFFNGSGGSPAAGARGSVTDSFYATARKAGLHVFGVSYRSDDAVGALCKGNDACFLPTRRAILTGVFEAGAASALSAIAPHEGAVARLVAGLRTLSALDPSGGWSAFLDPSATRPVDEIRWSNVLAAGHSQGGGHAALVGRTFAIDRVVALASPCDLAGAVPASWLDVTKGAYATSPKTSFHGLGAPGDTTCSGYPAIWSSLGLDASRAHADAIVCAGAGAHGAPIECVENAPVWKAMLD